MTSAREGKPITKRSLYSWVLGRNLKLQLVLLLIILATVFARVFPLEMQKRIVNDAIGLKDLEILILYCGLYIGAVVLASGLKFLINVLQGYIGQRTLVIIRRRLYEHVLTLPMPFFRRTSPGTVINSIVQEMIPVADFIGAAISVPMVNLLTFLALAGYMFSLNPLLGGLSVAIYPLELAVLPLLQKRLNRANRNRLSAMRKMSGVIGESISGIHEVQGNSSFPLEGKKFSGILSSLYKYSLAFYLHKFLVKVVNNLFQSMGPFILFLVGGYLAIKGHFDLGALVAFLSAYEKLYDPWKELMEFYQVYNDSKVRYKQAMSQFDLEPDFKSVSTLAEPLHVSGGIEIQDLSYVVPGNIKLLDRVSLSLKSGEHMALVGFSGSGKSTLALCVAQLYKYTGGSILLDGHEVKDLAKQDMVRNLAMVAQHPFIFDGTVRENLVYSCEASVMQGGECGGGAEIPDLDRLIEIVQQVGLFLDVLRFGLRTILDREEHADLVKFLINARRNFQERYVRELAEDIEFFDPAAYLLHSSVAENICFGAPLKEGFSLDQLHGNQDFTDFLERAELLGPLLALGRDIARRMVDIVRSLGPGPEIFEESPIPHDEFEEYASLADRLDKDFGKDLPAEDRRMLLKPALAFTPGVHRQVGVTPGFMENVVAARQRFRGETEASHPDLFSFYSQEEYIFSQSIQDNIVYGRVTANKAVVEERIMQLLIEENVLERVVEMGLNFQVGSMGDRLSGGQRQKTALARAFLKAPPIIILDEATSALDNASQTRIQNVLEHNFKGRSTVISVVHRLDTLPRYDSVCVLKAGKVIEHGSYQDLMERKGALHELVHGK